jgi:hypothetical protein
VLDALQPGWLGLANPPQTGGLHESFGDLTAIFLALSQLDQVEAVIAQTKANLHDNTFLSDLAEEFGLALGRPNGLRNADNDFKAEPSRYGSARHLAGVHRHDIRYPGRYLCFRAPGGKARRCRLAV